MPMATKIVEHVLDDLDGTEGAQTVSFSFEGSNYEIDLNEKNRDAFEKAVNPFIEAARRVSGSTTRGRAARNGSRSPSLATTKGYKIQEIRDWASANGIAVSDRGRIANTVVEQYEAARSNGRAPAKAAAKSAPAKTSRRKTTAAAGS